MIYGAENCILNKIKKPQKLSFGGEATVPLEFKRLTNEELKRV